MSGIVLITIVFAVIAVISALLVISVTNPVHSALALILNLVSIAALYYTLQAPFLMAAQLIVYAGAIVVLFLFVVMLLTSKGENPFEGGLKWLRPASVALGIVYLFSMVYVVKVQLPAVVLNGRQVVGTPDEIGRLLYRQYLLPFEATSLLLLAALVGSLYLGRNVSAEENESSGEEGA